MAKQTSKTASKGTKTSGKGKGAAATKKGGKGKAAC